MRLLNKLVVGASSVAFAAALVAGVNAPTASASSIGDGFEIDFDQQYMTIDSDDNKIIVSYPKYDSKKNQLGKDNNVCTYDNSEELRVDLSTLKVSSDNYIKIVGDVNTDPVVIKIPASDVLGKVTVNATNGAITSIPSKKISGKTYYASDLQYATTSSSWWESLEERSSFEDMTQLGATIRVRIAPTYPAKADGRPGNMFKEGTIAGQNDAKYTLYESLVKFPSKEIKAKIPKMANAPKAKVDYAKRTITIPKGCEYRINGKSNEFTKWQKNWVKVDANTALDAEKIDLANAGAVDVRKAATDRKPASKYSVTSWNGIYKIGVLVKPDKTQLVTSGSSIDSIYDPVTGGAVTIKSESTKSTVDAKGKVKVATSSTITVNNASSLYEYEYVMVDKGAAAPAVTAKATKIKKSVETKITIKNDSKYKDKDIYIRRAVVKTKGSEKWVTNWVKLATVTENAYKVTLG